MSRPKQFGKSYAVGLVAVVVLVCGMWVYVLGRVLLSPLDLALILGPAEGYAWTATRYQLAYSRFERQLFLYKTGDDTNLGELRRLRDNLQAAFGILTRPSELSAFFVGIPQYEDAVPQLRRMMATLDAGVLRLETNPDDTKALDDMLAAMQRHWQPIQTLLNNFRLIEMRQRDRAFRDYQQKREMLLGMSVLVVLLFAASLVQLALVLRRRQRVIQQQRTTLIAERQATMQARATVQARNTLLAMVSHELRTPLQAITAAVDLLLSRYQDERDAAAIGRVQTAAQDLLELVTDLTDYARLEAGKLELNRMEFDIAVLVRDLVEKARGLAVGKPVEVSSVIETDATRLVSDPHRVRQILDNLVANAIRYTDTGSVVVTVGLSATTAQSQPAMQIAVTDTGPGIAEADRMRVFEPFTRLDPSNTRAHDGLGMGLSIVRALTRALGGDIAVHSELGRGTTFRLSLPLQNPGPAVGMRGPDVPFTPLDLRHRRMLVVDDHASAREALMSLVGLWGVIGEACASADEACQKLAGDRYDALLLDIAMPGRDGIAVAGWLRASASRNQSIPIVAISAYLPAWLTDDQRRDFDAYLAKPVRANELAATLQQLLPRSDASER